jgi:hypothetical protein
MDEGRRRINPREEEAYKSGGGEARRIMKEGR